MNKKIFVYDTHYIPVGEKYKPKLIEIIECVNFCIFEENGRSSLGSGALGIVVKEVKTLMEENYELILGKTPTGKYLPLSSKAEKLFSKIIK